jgi:hypothetical protein
MKHPLLVCFLSSTAALSLSACRETTAPGVRRVDSPSHSADRLTGAPDSSVVWSAAALDDAASRLTAALDDERARLELSAALRAVSSGLRAGAADGELASLHDAAQRATQQFRRKGVLAEAELDAITLTLDHAREVIRSRTH